MSQSGQRVQSSPTLDYVVIGSGFGGSVSAMRLTEKGYSVLVLERGKRYADSDFPRSSWQVRKFLWLPLLRCFGIQQMSLLNGLTRKQQVNGPTQQIRKTSKKMI